jgi:hypothetical protein
MLYEVKPEKETIKQFLEREGKLVKFGDIHWIKGMFPLALSDGMFLFLALNQNDVDFINKRYTSEWYMVRGERILEFTNPAFEQHISTQ